MEKEEKIAEFIGIMLGDGSIGIYKTKQNKKLHQLKVTLDSRNKQYINYVADLMEGILDTKPKIFYKKNENAVDIRVFKKEKVLFVLNNLGLKISPKWGKAEIPRDYCRGKFYRDAGLCEILPLFRLWQGRNN